MQSHEFETICRWVAARLRRTGVNVTERDPDFMDAVSTLELESVTHAVSLDDVAISGVAKRLRHEQSQAA